MKQLAARGLLSAASAELKFEELVALYSTIGVQHTLSLLVLQGTDKRRCMIPKGTTTSTLPTRTECMQSGMMVTIVGFDALGGQEGI